MLVKPVMRCARVCNMYSQFTTRGLLVAGITPVTSHTQQINTLHPIITMLPVICVIGAIVLETPDPRDSMSYHYKNSNENKIISQCILSHRFKILHRYLSNRLIFSLALDQNNIDTIEIFLLNFSFLLEKR